MDKGLINQLVVLKNLSEGDLSADDFSIIERPVPEIKAGEVLLKSLYFSLDPYMKKILRPGKAYADFHNTLSMEAIQGASVCLVERSKNSQLKKGDMVLAYTGWQKYTVSKGKLSSGLPWDIDSVRIISGTVKPTHYLGALGMTGLAGYSGLLDIGQPKAGETVVVSAATGAVGSIVGQLAKTKGCRVIGIAGGVEKCQTAIQDLGFDDCVDHKSQNFSTDLKKACPQKIDVYFDNVGGDVFYNVLTQLNDFSRVVLCGSMVWANQSGNPIPMGPDMLAMIYFSKIPKRLKLQSFLVLDYMDQYDTFLQNMTPLIESGAIKSIEDIVKGIKNAPQAFIDLLNGRHKGKVLIEL